LQSARTLEAPAEFRSVALTRMNNLIDSQPRPTRKRARVKLAAFGKMAGGSMAHGGRLFSFRTVIIAVIALFIFLVVGVGVVYAASNALPGNIFYPLKNTVEMVQLAVTTNVYNQATLTLNFSQRRLAETRVHIQNQEFGEAKFSLIDYQVEAITTLDSLSKSSPLSDDQRLDLARQALEKYTHNEAYLQDFLDQTPDIARSSVEASLDLTDRVLEKARQVIEAP
jgi:hypothetical protein